MLQRGVDYDNRRGGKIIDGARSRKVGASELLERISIHDFLMRSRQHEQVADFAIQSRNGT